MDSLYRTKDSSVFFIAPSDWDYLVDKDTIRLLKDGKWQRGLGYIIWGCHCEKVLDITPKSRLSIVVLTGTTFEVKE